MNLWGTVFFVSDVGFAFDNVACAASVAKDSRSLDCYQLSKAETTCFVGARNFQCSRRVPWVNGGCYRQTYPWGGFFLVLPALRTAEKCQKNRGFWVVRYADLKLYSSVAAGILSHERLWNKPIDPTWPDYPHSRFWILWSWRKSCFVQRPRCYSSWPFLRFLVCTRCDPWLWLPTGTEHRGLFSPWCQWQWQGGRANKRCRRCFCWISIMI